MTQTPEKVILGIDPGTSVLGYAAVRTCGKKCEMLAMGVIDLRKCKDVYLKLGRILLFFNIHSIIYPKVLYWIL